MSLTPYQRLFNEFFNDFYDSVGPLANSVNSQLEGLPVIRYPRYNMEVYDDKYVYAFDLPGVKKDEITINESGGIVTVKGERKRNISENKPNYRYTETRYGSFSRSFNVEDDGDCETMNATLNDGVLRVTIQRTKKENMSRSVTIQ
ncbi:molecular chaperone IbpA HSP20 family [Fadolivirus algeromassiliense]|jgi:HSP20 family protein|uniref:Molecular chaperone IbpA HSP20 family n=1 Tax=Fadolivirus FV1/VV64 TaxID=3070911 RepID=A0A7D3UVR0_9VIRU|nr:molecular chaperone IbpA HSP20 family [Fadolivirus algeromassiliense]QKF94254.1 molecular chaperone IbpA HSP20 family [Fadolivirus FV1/VV64]